jgi:hypothetical protein
VDFELSVLIEAHRLIAKFRIAGSEHRGKGDYHAAEIRIWVLPLDAPPPLTAEHPGWRSFAATATPWQHTFTEAELGQRLYICMRWENASTGNEGNDADGKGPWSGIQTVIIP